MNIKDYLEQKRIDVDRFLDSVMPSAATAPTTLHESIRYSLMAGGSESARSWPLPRQKPWAARAGLMPLPVPSN